ncbi:MAG: TRAP transporter small permease subunit [Duodenibacillus sp.]|nr:TRAP transporter small permease subunit [Duodenibacillus sp.]
MQQMLSFLKAADLWVSRVTRAVCVASMMLVFGMFLLNVLLRFVPVINLTQIDEWIQVFLVWMIFLGAQELVRTRSHFVVDVLTDRVAGTAAGRVMRVAVCVIELVMYAVICWYGWVLVGRAQAYMQTITWLQVRWLYAVIPLSASFMTLYALRDLALAAADLLRGGRT